MHLQRPAVATRPLDTVLEAVPSKSVTHRALILAALGDGPSSIRNPLDATDTRVTLDGLDSLGFATSVEPQGWQVSGRGGLVTGGGSVTLGESGTSARFLAALAALGRPSSRLDGSPGLRRRPMDDLLHALRHLGARVDPASARGLPFSIAGPARGGFVTLPPGPSSQFASALLLIGSSLADGIDLTLTPPVVSRPYVETTLATLAAFGVTVERPEPLRFKIPAGSHAGRSYRVEGDHSAASYFLAAPAIAGGRVRITGLDPCSDQADRRLGSILEGIGCEVARGEDWVEVAGGSRLQGFDLDLSEAPDLVPTLAVVAMFAGEPSRIRGVAHLRVKESDRLEAIASNLRLLGCPARACEDRLEIEGCHPPFRGARIATRSDHRIAMAFAVAGLKIEGLELDDAACVAKSNPAFWAQYARLTG